LATGVTTQPVTALHESVVHGFESLQLSAVPAVQVPVWHVSAPLQALPSEQEVPFDTFACAQPLTALHVSVVHRLLSLQLSAVPGVQAPPWQVSEPLHTFPSGQGVPLVTGAVAQPVAGLQLSVVHPFPSLQTSGVPAVQVPA
jgi:hypothetical protein